MHGESHFLDWSKKSANVWVILLEDCKKVIMAWENSIVHGPDRRIQPALEQWFLQFFEDEADHFCLPRGCCWIYPSRLPKVRLRESPFTFMNRLMKVAVCLGVSSFGNSYFIEPGSSSSLLWPTVKEVWLEISWLWHPTVPDQIPLHIPGKRHGLQIW